MNKDCSALKKIKKSLKDELIKLLKELDEQMQCDGCNCNDDCPFSCYNGMGYSYCALAYAMSGIEALEVKDDE